MSRYEIEFKSCDSIVEVLVRAMPKTNACPGCGNADLKRLLSVLASPTVKSKSSLSVTGTGEPCGTPRCCGGPSWGIVVKARQCSVLQVEVYLGMWPLAVTR